LLLLLLLLVLVLLVLLLLLLLPLLLGLWQLLRLRAHAMVRLGRRYCPVERR
jgi:hypothetical protein